MHAQNPALTEKKNLMNHIFDTEDEEQSSTQLKFLKTLIDKLIKGRKHPTGAPPSSRTTNYFYGKLTNYTQNTDLNVHNSLPDNCLEAK